MSLTAHVSAASRQSCLVASRRPTLGHQTLSRLALDPRVPPGHNRTLSGSARRRAERSIGARALEPSRADTAVEQESAEVDSAEPAEGKKYYRTVPGFPNVMVEFDHPEPERKKREKPVLWKTFLLACGVVLMLTESATIFSLLS